ncbi:MAG: hypothetical protein J4O01_10695 [Chloroflexi bacterium]|nr:hypothetical protein [Chloroflexota bacterium]MCI0803954.1 hypothetical protein [Chloroflexota bacterium]MCI0808695.1 hypothetical protein [Chloroflexota bacterium]MCI0837923.1 hypothetical protein [Chloroflexota bacterium]MCI0852509.1 hypothetical protein [Chloroflexota bacterium]
MSKSFSPQIGHYPGEPLDHELIFMMNRNMLKKAQQMQARLAAVQDEIAQATTSSGWRLAEPWHILVMHY